MARRRSRIELHLIWRIFYALLCFPFIRRGPQIGNLATMHYQMHPDILFGGPIYCSTLVGAMCCESTLSKRFRASIEKDTSHKPPDRPSATHHMFVRKADDEKPSLERNRQFLPSSVDSVIIRRCSQLFRHSHTAIGQFFRNRMWSKIANQTRDAISTALSFNAGILNYLLGSFRTRALLPQCTYADYSIASTPFEAGTRVVTLLQDQRKVKPYTQSKLPTRREPKVGNHQIIQYLSSKPFRAKMQARDNSRSSPEENWTSRRTATSLFGQPLYPVHIRSHDVNSRSSSQQILLTVGCHTDTVVDDV
jgi:hypothetical protein